MLFASRRLKRLEEEVAKVKRMVEDRDLDWVDMRSRCKRLLDRTEKAAARIPTQDTSASEEPASSNGTAHPGRLLTPHQLEVQQAILRRRSGG